MASKLPSVFSASKLLASEAIFSWYLLPVSTIHLGNWFKVIGLISSKHPAPSKDFIQAEECVFLSSPSAETISTFEGSGLIA